MLKFYVKKTVNENYSRKFLMLFVMFLFVLSFFCKFVAKIGVKTVLIGKKRTKIVYIYRFL